MARDAMRSESPLKSLLTKGFCFYLLDPRASLRMGFRGWRADQCCASAVGCICPEKVQCLIFDLENDCFPTFSLCVHLITVIFADSPVSYFSVVSESNLLSTYLGTGQTHSNIKIMHFKTPMGANCAHCKILEQSLNKLDDRYPSLLWKCSDLC